MKKLSYKVNNFVRVPSPSGMALVNWLFSNPSELRLGRFCMPVGKCPDILCPPIQNRTLEATQKGCQKKSVFVLQADFHVTTVLAT